MKTMVALGISVLLIAGICQGSFGLGFKKFPPFSWSVFWGIYNILCTVVALLFAFLCAPQMLEVLLNFDRTSLNMAFVLGCIWGASAICFSKGIDKVGMSLVYGISMGISTIVGSVTPMLMDQNAAGLTTFRFWVSLLLMLGGIAFVTLAGIKRDGKLQASAMGILFSVISGVGSGFMNVGFFCTEGVYAPLQAISVPEIGISAVRWVPVLLGGNMIGLLWCIAETTVKKQWHTLTAKGSAVRVGKLFGVSIVWYAALMLYGYATHLLGSAGDTVGWILFNSLALLISIFWGFKTGEWKNQPKTILFIGCGLMIVSWIFAI